METILLFFSFDNLEKELEGLPPLHRIAFAASCCERLLPNYNAFSRIESWGKPSVLRDALDKVWQIPQGKPIDSVEISKLIEYCNGEDIIPHADDFAGYIVEAQEAAFAICNALEACLDPNTWRIVEVAKHVTNTIDAFLNFDESLNILWNESHEKYKETIANHPLVVREIMKQNEDLQRLQERTTLDRNFLERLRTSFDNDGKSLIDLS